MLKVVQVDVAANENAAGGSLLDEIVRDGARAMLAAALQAEVAAYIDAHAEQVDEDGRRLVVRNGYHGEREVATAAGAVPVRAPRVNDKRVDEVTGERRRFSSAILPAWARKSPRVAEVLPLLYLHGLSTGDFVPALEQFLPRKREVPPGSAAGLSASTVTRLTAQWQDDATAAVSMVDWRRSGSLACRPTDRLTPIRSSVLGDQESSRRGRLGLEHVRASSGVGRARTPSATGPLGARLGVLANAGQGANR